MVVGRGYIPPSAQFSIVNAVWDDINRKPRDKQCALIFDIDQLLSL